MKENLKRDKAGLVEGVRLTSEEHSSARMFLESEQEKRGYVKSGELRHFLEMTTGKRITRTTVVSTLRRYGYFPDQNRAGGKWKKL